MKSTFAIDNSEDINYPTMIGASFSNLYYMYLLLILSKSKYKAWKNMNHSKDISPEKQPFGKIYHKATQIFKFGEINVYSLFISAWMWQCLLKKFHIPESISTFHLLCVQFHCNCLRERPWSLDMLDVKRKDWILYDVGFEVI